MKSEESKQFTKYYQQERVTGTYDKQREGNEYRINKRRKELRYFLDLLYKKGDEEVLELGCSSGFLTKHLGKVTAIDTSTDMLKIAHSKNKLANCIPGDMFDLKFEDNSFDKVITMRVWNHLDKEDLIKAIREVKKVLKPNGYLIFDAEEKNWLRRLVAYWYQIITGITGFKIYQYSFAEIREIVEELRFEIKDYQYLKHKIGRQIIFKARLKNINKKGCGKIFYGEIGDTIYCGHGGLCSECGDYGK